MNGQNKIWMLISVLSIFLFWGTSILAQENQDSLFALEQAELAAAAVERAQIEVEKAKKARESIISCGWRGPDYHKTPSFAQHIAIKSWKTEDENRQGLLAKEAYEMNKANGGNPYDAYIYEAIYKATAKLKESKENNPKFNILNQTPEGEERLGRIRTIKVAPNTNDIYTISSDGYLLEWALETYNNQKERNEHKPTVLFKDKDHPRTLDISSDGQYLIFAGDKGKVKLYDLHKKRIIKKGKFKLNDGKRIWAVKFLPDGKGFVSIGDDGLGSTSISYTNMMNGQSKLIVEHTPVRVTFMDISNDGKYVVAARKSNKTWAWNIETGECEFVLEDSRMKKYNVTAVAVEPKGRFIATGYQDGTLMIWDMQKFLGDSSYVPEERLRSHSARISDLAFSKDGTMLIVGSLDKTASLWIIRDLAKKGEGAYKEFPYQDPRFHPIKFEDHDDWVTSVGFSNDGTKVVTGCNNGIMKIWEIDMTVYAEQICELVGENLSDREWRIYIGTDDEEGKEFYILTAENKRRTPLSTCGASIPQRVNK